MNEHAREVIDCWECLAFLIAFNAGKRVRHLQSTISQRDRLFSRKDAEYDDDNCVRLVSVIDCFLARTQNMTMIIVWKVLKMTKVLRKCLALIAQSPRKPTNRLVISLPKNEKEVMILRQN